MQPTIFIDSLCGLNFIFVIARGHIGTSVQDFTPGGGSTLLIFVRYVILQFWNIN
jgi:hypothetical protein